MRSSRELESGVQCLVRCIEFAFDASQFIHCNTIVAAAYATFFHCRERLNLRTHTAANDRSPPLPAESGITSPTSLHVRVEAPHDLRRCVSFALQSLYDG